MRPEQYQPNPGGPDPCIVSGELCACDRYRRSAELEYCEWQGCHNKRCGECLVIRHDPVLIHKFGAESRLTEYKVCESCADALDSLVRPTP